MNAWKITYLKAIEFDWLLVGFRWVIVVGVIRRGIG